MESSDIKMLHYTTISYYFFNSSVTFTTGSDDTGATVSSRCNPQNLFEGYNRCEFTVVATTEGEYGELHGGKVR